MTLKNKSIITVVLLLISFILGCYLSGFILLQWLGLDKTPLLLTTWFKYYNTLDIPQVAKYSLQIKTSGIVGFGFTFLIGLLGLIPIWRTASQSLHGEARFAGMADLTKAGFFKQTDTSIVVGKYNGKLLHYNGQQFALLAAPTRSGKGVGIVIPNLLSYKGSVVVLDIKQENFNLTSGYRKEVLGQEVYLFNPFAEDGRTHRWNPFTYVSSDPDQRVSDLMSIAAMLYPDGDSRDKFWVAQARNAFLAFSLYCFDEHEAMADFSVEGKENEPACTLGKIYRLSSGNGTELKEYFTSLSQQPYLSEATKTAFSGLISQEKETFGSIMGTFKEPLNPWINPVIDAATSADDFLLTDVRKKKMTVYIGILPNKLAESRVIVNLFFSQLINQNTKELPQEGLKADGSKIRVLVVDHSMFVAKQLGQILSSEGYEIIATAADGKEGVDKYKELCPNVDLVTMDITMPRMDGITALEQIMTFDKNARVVMVSALGKEELVKKSLLLGAKNYIIKPLDRKKVLERISSSMK